MFVFQIVQRSSCLPKVCSLSTLYISLLFLLIQLCKKNHNCTRSCRFLHSFINCANKFTMIFIIVLSGKNPTHCYFNGISSLLIKTGSDGVRRLRWVHHHDLNEDNPTFTFRRRMLNK